MDEELEVIVQKMLDAGEPEENIKLVIEEFNKPKAKEETIVETVEEKPVDSDPDEMDIYADKLTEIAEAEASDEQVEAWKAQAIEPETSFFDYFTTKTETTYPWQTYFNTAKQSLQEQNKQLPEDQQVDITTENIKNKAIDIYVSSQEDEWQTGLASEVLEDFETEYGVDRTSSFGSAVETLSQFSVPGIIYKYAKGARNLYNQELDDQEKEKKEKDYFGFLIDQGYKNFGTEQQENYFNNRKKLYNKLSTKESELEKEYAGKVSDITARRQDIDKSLSELNKYEKRIKEKDPNFTEKDYKDYQNLFNNIKKERELFNKEIDELGKNAIPSNDFETIKNLTLKTYDNLDMVVNNVSSSIVNLAGGLATVKNELRVPELLKWAGVDIGNDEDLNKVFGKEDSFLKDIVGTYGKTSNKVADAISASFELGNAIKGQNAPIASISDVDNVGDFGMYMLDLASGQAVNTALTIAVPPVGLTILAASAAGGKMDEMNKEIEGIKGPDGEYIVPPKDINALQYFGTAALYGGVEYATERVSLGILKGGMKNVQKAFSLTGKTGSNLTLKNLTNFQQFKKLGYDFGKDSFKESGAEGIVQLTNNLADMYVLGNKDVSLMDGMTDAMAAGFFMGNMYQSPNLVAGVTQSFSSEGEYAEANKLNGQLVKLSEQRNDLLRKGKDAGPLQIQIDKILDQQMKAMNKVQQRTLDMTPSDRQGMIDLYNKEHKIRAEIDGINESPDYTPEIKKIMINDLAQDLAEAEANRERIIGDATFNADIKRQSDLAREIRAENGTLDIIESVVADNADDALQQGLDYIDGLDYTDQQKNALKNSLETEFNNVKQKSKTGDKYHGFAWGDNIEIETQKDGKMVKETLNVPMQFALDKSNMTVQSHELGHNTVFKEFMRNNPDAVGLVDDLEAYVKKNYKEAYKRFEAVRQAYANENLTKEQTAEEQLANLSDFMRQSNLKGDRTLYNKLFGRFQKINDGKNQIETGKDVFDMLNSYNQSFETGQLQGLAKSVIKGDAVIKRKAQDQRDVNTNKQISDLQESIGKDSGKFSKSLQGETAMEKSKRQNKRNVDVKDIYTKDAVGKDNEQWREFLDSNKGSRVLGDMINMYYPDMIASAINKKAADPMEVASEAIEPLMKHIQAFNPEQNTDLAGYVGGYLGLKVGTGAKKVAKKTPTISMEQEGVRQVVEKQAVKETAKEEAPVRKGIKLAERLGDAAKKISDKVKQMKPVLEGKAYKTLKDLAPNDTQEMFGIVPKPGNLTKQDVKNAQAFINKNADILLAMLPEGTTVGGKATGVQKVLLDAFYTKGRRVKAAKTGSTAGLPTQNKKPNIKISEFKEVFGITPAGQPNIADRNTSARIKALVDQTGKLLTNQAVREVTPTAPKEIAEGKSKVMFSKKLPTKAEQRKIDRQKKLYEADPGAQVLAENKSFDEIQRDYGIQPINLNTQEGKNELKSRIFEGTETAAPFMTIIPESVLTTGTLSNGGLNESTRPRKVLADTKAGRKLLIKMRESGFFGKGKPSNSEVERTYTLTDGSKIKNTDPKFLTEDIQLRIAPVGRFLFANKLQIDNAIAEAKAKGHEFAPENSKIAMAVKRQGYTAKLLKEMKEPGFFEKQMEKRDGLKDLIMVFDEAVQFNKIEYLPVVAGLLSATSGSQGHLGRTGSIVEFYNTLDLKNVEEHTEPASDLMKFFVNRMAQGNLNEYIDPALDSFFQGALPEVYDGMLKGTGKDGGKFNYIKNVPAEYIADVLLGLKPVWIRYFNPNVNSQIRVDEKGNVHIGINPNVIILSNGKSIAENYGLKLDSKNINPETIALQQDLLFKIFNGNITVKEAQGDLKAVLPVKIQQSKSATPANITMLNSSGVTKASKNLNNKETIRQASIMDKALNSAKDPNAPVKKIRIFDFDDTLARTKSNVLYTMSDGTSGKLTAEQFAKRGTEMLEQGAEFDFSEFNKVIDGKKGPLFEVAEAIAGKRGTSDMFVLTARTAESAPAIKEFLDALGLNIPIENITGLGDSSPLAKSGWIVSKAAEGYNDFYFADDAVKNVKAVSQAMSKLDVKSKTQLAKQNNIKFSKSLVKKLDWKTDKASNMTSNFRIKNKSYLARLYPVDNKGDYRYEFELETKTGSTQAITGTGNAISVFSTVYNGLIDAINSNSKIKRVEFSANKSEPSRVRVYTSVMNRLNKDLGWNTDIWETTDWDGGGSFDFEITKPRQKQSKPVEKVLNVVDVKSETQQSKIKFSKNVDQIFNDIIENKTGVASETEYSRARAQTAGANKGRFKFWIAPSAEDFVGLLYPLLSKGKLGDSQMAWFKKHLLDPYGRAMENISREQNRLSNDFKALKKALVESGTIPKNLNKKALDNFTFQDIARITAWHTQGMDIPGLSNSDLNKILDFVRENPGIKEFADQLIMINKGQEYTRPRQDWLAGTISTDLLEGLRDGKRSQYLQEWQANKDLIFSEKNLNKLEAVYGKNYREALENMLRRMETGSNRTSTAGRLENRLLDYVNNSVGAVMFFNMRSGVLQLLSAVNFLNWSDNNPLKAGIAFANQPQYWKDFMRLMNSDFLIDRRNGLKINVSESEIADAASNSKNKARGVISYLLQKGFTVTQVMDSFAIASGGATFYRNKLKKYKKQGLSEADAEAKAYQDFRETAEESQQSSRPDRISQQQASSLGRIILAFANTPMQYGRIMKKSFLDLKNGRGDWKSNMSKILYYGALQNILFTGMQQAMFALAFNDEEEEDEAKKKKYYKMVDSMGDNILRGLGLWGQGASTLIRIAREAIKQSQREGYPGADYDLAALELLSLSPPIDIKMSKLRQAGMRWKYEGWKHDEARWGINDPAYESAASVIAALTNFPADRIYRKLDNVQSALDSDNETWKRVANILGWSNWELESSKDRKDRIDLEKEQKKKVAEKVKIEKMTPEEKKARELEVKTKKYKDLNKAEQVKKLDSLGLTKQEIRDLKYEKDRVNKLIELMEK